jgi:4-aminobutyrate aminotransferase-like enzyme
VSEFAYHGVTTATIALSPEEWAGNVPGHIATVPAPDDLFVDAWVDHIDAAVAELTRKGKRPAAFYVDSMFTSDGIFPPPSGLLQRAVRRLHDAGCLVVADEVQCGFGRIGSHMWSFQASGITPDFVTLGKPMGNGHPVAAVVTRAEIAERFATKTDMFSTFGGNPVASRAALAVLDVIEEEGLQQRAAAVGARLRSNLDEVMDAHSAIAEVRGTGLMIGVELVGDPETGAPAPDLAHSVMNDMKERGVLIGTTGPHGNVLKIRPPLVLTLEEADLIADTLDASLRFVLTEARI